MRPIIAILTAAFVLAAAAVADARPPARNCGGHITDAQGAPVGVTIRRGNSTCASAKRILRAYLHSTAPCEGSACRRKHHGWTCLTASPASYPRVASCSRRRRDIAAYAITD
jgi:hypothetical protein